MKVWQLEYLIVRLMHANRIRSIVIETYPGEQEGVIGSFRSVNDDADADAVMTAEDDGWSIDVTGE